MFLLIYLFCPYITLGGTESGTEIIDDHTFIDDVGNLIEINKPCKTIISLFDEHTENLYYLGAENLLTGVGESSTFPAEVNSLPKYKTGNNFDAEQIIRENPDVVLSAPEINEKHPAFITKLETNGVFVVSLRPDSPEEFDIYIQKLGIITGHREEAEKQLALYHREIEEIKKKSAESSNKVTAFIESSESGYLTPSLNTLPYEALKLNGVKNVAAEKLKHRDKEKNVYFGMKNLQKNKENIDRYFLLRGGGNSAAAKVSMMQKNDFKDFPVMKNQEIYEISEKIMDSYTFRYITGLKETGRICYPEIYGDITEFRTDQVLTRKNFAEIVYRYLNVPTFINTKKEYYDFQRFNHLYGTFEDVKWSDSDFNVIETVVMRNYLDFSTTNESKFNREKEVTRTDVAKFLNILCKIHGKDEHKVIRDLPAGTEGNIIQMVTDNHLMDTEQGYFHPEKEMTNNEFIEILEDITENRLELL